MQCSLSSFYFPCKNYYYTICIINIESLPFFIFFFQFAIYRKRNLTLVILRYQISANYSYFWFLVFVRLQSITSTYTLVANFALNYVLRCLRPRREMNECGWCNPLHLRSFARFAVITVWGKGEGDERGLFNSHLRNDIHGFVPRQAFRKFILHQGREGERVGTFMAADVMFNELLVS